LALKNPGSISSLLNRISNDSDEKAFKELFDSYAFRLVGFANSFLNNYELSEEVVSDVFFKIWTQRDLLGRIENFRAYLFKATRNTALNYIDNEKTAKAERLEDLNVDLIIDHIDPEIALINSQLREAIEDAIASLPPKCKLIYNLAKVEKMKYKEIAALLQVSVKTIDNQIAIAIKKIGTAIQLHQGNDDSGTYSILLQLFIPVE
jgi:RNA polymerase sigma-70 factor (ECF subfamily)